jgi:hypothetical protein
MKISKYKKLVTIGLVTFFLFSCNYKIARRNSDINYHFFINISPFYVKKYMKSIDTLYMNRNIITSEIINYPENFIPVTDSENGYKYVIAIDYLDSIQARKANYISMASLYDFKKQEWITDRDSLTNHELDKFENFFKKNVLQKTIDEYEKKVPDSLLYIKKSDSMRLELYAFRRYGCFPSLAQVFRRTTCVYDTASL